MISPQSISNTQGRTKEKLVDVDSGEEELFDMVERETSGETYFGSKTTSGRSKTRTGNCSIKEITEQYNDIRRGW